MDYRHWKNPKKKRFWVLALIILYTLIGFFLAPVIIRHQLVSILSDTLQRPVTVQQVTLNPFTFRATVEDFSLTERDGSNIASFDQFEINFQLTSPFYRAWTFRDVRLVNPMVDITRLSSGKLNLQMLIPESDTPQPDESGAIPSLLLQNLEIVNGTVNVADKMKEPVYTNTLSPIDIRLVDFGTRQGQEGDHALVLFSESGASLELEGDVVVAPLTVTGNLKARGPYLPLAYEYVKDLLAVEVKKGELVLDLDFAVQEQEETIRAAVNNVTFELHDILVSEKAGGEQILALDEAALSGFVVTWPAKNIAAKKLALSGSELSLVRQPDGSFNWQHLLASPAGPATGSNAGTDQPAGSPDQGEESAAPFEMPLPDWNINLAEFAIDNMNIDFADRQLKEPANLGVDGISLNLRKLSNRGNQPLPVGLTASLGENGSVDFQGELQLLPDWQVNGDLEVDSLPLPLFQPYVGETINARLVAGDVTVATTVASSADSPLDLQADLTVSNLDVVNTNDDNPLVSWQTLTAPKLSFNANPLTLRTGAVTLKQPYLKLTIHEDQSTNFHRLMVDAATAHNGENGETAAAEAETAEPRTAPEPTEAQEDPEAPEDTDSTRFNLAIAEIAIHKGTVDFADFSLPIPFEDELSQLDGALTDYVTAGKTPASLKLHGQVAEYGVVDVTGRISPWDFTADTELALDLENIDLPNLKPYSIKFVGREIDNGKMNLDLDYRLQKGALEGNNDIVITQFDLGKKVPQEGALNLPLDMAVALLKGPNGTIDLNLPVSGDTDNPQFDIGSIVLNAFSNLITKAVTAPFRLLASLVGSGGDDFDRVYFEPGSAGISPPAREKIDKLVEAFKQRPQLGLQVKGVYATGADSVAIKAARLDQLIDSARLEAFGEDSSRPRGEQRLAIMEDMVEEAFGGDILDAIKDKHPASEEGNLPRAYRTELRTKLLENVSVEPAALEQLGSQRAQNIVAQITGEDRLNPDRVSTLQTAAVKNPGKQGVPLTLEVSNLD